RPTPGRGARCGRRRMSASVRCSSSSSRSGGGSRLGGESGAKDWFSFAVFLGLLVVAGSVVNLFYRLWALKVSYRCPECGARPVRVFEALPDVHFYCRACNVEWDTGLKELADQS